VSLESTKLVLGKAAHKYADYFETCRRQSAPIIVRNTIIPTRKTVGLMAEDCEGAVLLRILAGESLWAEKNLVVTELELAVPKGRRKLELTLDIDANSILRVTAQDCTTN